jgi:hypothetical protein
VLEGNATKVYRAQTSLADLRLGRQHELAEVYQEEIFEFEKEADANAGALAAAGIRTAALAHPERGR